MSNFVVQAFGFFKVRSFVIPSHINEALDSANTPKEIEETISKYESELAQLINPDDEFLICDSAAELMADVLRSKGINYQIICGVNDAGDSHSYIQVDGVNYDPTEQGFGDGGERED